MHRSPYYPYPERPGMGLETMSDVATEPLTDPQLQSVIDFENQLYETTSLEAVWRLKHNQTLLSVDYALSEAGQAAIEAATGQTLVPDEASLHQLDIRGINSKTLNKLEADSIAHEESRITQAFIANGYEGEGVPAPRIITLSKNPEVVAEKAEHYRLVKRQLKQQLRGLASEPETHEQQAKVLVAELYKRRVNMLLVDTYISAHGLLRQPQTAKVQQRIADVMPVFKPDTSDERAARLLQNMDRLLNGVGGSQPSWLSLQAAKLADGSATVDTDTIDRGEYDSVDPVRLEQEIDAETVGTWFSSVLQEYDLLSEQTEWDSERTEPAADGKWQVIVDDKFKSLAVVPKQRIIKVPAKTMTIGKAVTLISHEVTHVFQHENKRALGQLAIFEHIGTDTVSEQTEAGALWQERLARETLTGEVSTDINGTSYLAALRVKVEGGSFGQCLEAYFTDLSTRMPQLSPEKAAAQAVNRTRRIFRNGGLEFAQNTPFVTNTQPLKYLEQRLIYENLPEDQRKLLFVGGIAVNTIAELASLGIVDLTAIRVPEPAPWVLLHKHVTEALQ